MQAPDAAVKDDEEIEDEKKRNDAKRKDEDEKKKTEELKKRKEIIDQIERDQMIEKMRKSRGAPGREHLGSEGSTDLSRRALAPTALSGKDAKTMT